MLKNIGFGKKSEFMFIWKFSMKLFSQAFFGSSTYHYTVDYIIINVSKLKTRKIVFDIKEMFLTCFLSLVCFFKVFPMMAVGATIVLNRTGSQFLL